MFGNPKNVLKKKKFSGNFQIFSELSRNRNPKNSVIPKGDTEFPKILFRAFSIPDAKKFGNGPTLD